MPKSTAMANHNLVVIGVSTGGPIVLKQIFTAIPPLNAAVIIVLHIRSGMDRMIVRGLAAVSSMPATLAVDGEYLRTGHLYLAPGGTHLTLEGNRRIGLVAGERINYVQPSADMAMKSLSRSHSGKIVGVVLTGMGRDGAEGIRHIKRIDGITMAQDQVTSAVFGMPKAAWQTGAVDFVLSPKNIAKKLVELLE